MSGSVVRLRTMFEEDESPPQVVDCSGDPMITRQEQRAAADVNLVIARYISSGRLPDLREGVAGLVDFDLDLVQTMGLREQARQVWNGLSAEQKAKYSSPEAMLVAYAQMEFDLSDPDPKRRSGDQPRDRRAVDKAAADAAAFSAAVEAAAAKRSAAGG